MKPNPNHRKPDFLDALGEVELALRQSKALVAGSEAQADMLKINLLPAIEALKTVIEDYYPGKLTDHI